MVKKIKIGELISFGDKPAPNTLVDTPSALINLVCLSAGQELPQHNANSNVNLLILEGCLTVMVVDEVVELGNREMVEVPFGTLMQISNKSDKNTAFLVIKTPNPSQMS